MYTCTGSGISRAEACFCFVVRLWGNPNAGAETSCGQPAIGPSRIHGSVDRPAGAFAPPVALLADACPMVKTGAQCRVLLSIHSHLQRSSS